VADNSIVIDGSLSIGEWPAEIFTDPPGDEQDLAMQSGTDLGRFYLAKDTNYLYVAMQLNDGNPRTAATTAYLFQANQSRENDNSYGDIYTTASYDTIDARWEVTVGQRSWVDPYGLYGPGVILYNSPTGVAAGANVVEWRTPLAQIGSLSGKFVRAYIHAFYEQWDINDDNLTGLMLDPESISGTVTSAVYTDGLVYIAALNSYGEIVAGTYLTDLSVPYTIPGLAAGTPVQLYAVWDSDGNGILSAGDYLEYSGAFPVGTTPTVNLAVNSHPPSIGISGNVINVHLPDDSYVTYLVIDVLSGYTEPLPYTVEHITVTGPNGLAVVCCTKGGVALQMKSISADGGLAG
jgi:hypothetical protein